MSGRKVFTAGEVLQAADVNDYLMDQSVMVFAGTAARGSAIPSPTEGMVSYLSDADELQVYTTAWGAVGGGLVQVKSVLKTDTFSASVASGADVAVTDLSITHALSNSANKLIISAFFGAASSSNGYGRTALALHDGSGLIAVGDSPGSRTAVTSGGVVSGSTVTYMVSTPAVTLVHSPGDTSSRTYTVRAVNVEGSTSTVYINRTADDTDNAVRVRAVSGFVIQEVAV